MSDYYLFSIWVIHKYLQKVIYSTAHVLLCFF